MREAGARRDLTVAAAARILGSGRLERPMRRGTVRVLRACGTAVLGFMIAAVLGLGVRVIGAAATDSGAPYGPTIRGDGQIVDVNGMHRFADDAGAGAGKPVGHAKYVIKALSRGRPRTVSRTCEISVESVEPAAGAPPASDAVFWRRAVGESIAGSALSRLVPPGFAASDQAKLTERYWSAYFTNGVLTIGRVPGWWAAGATCAAAAFVVGSITFARDRRCGAHLCGHCGYDLRGAPMAVCPECGRAPA